MEQRRLEKRWSVSQAATKAGISRPTWTALEKGETSRPDARTLRSVEDSLDWSHGSAAATLEGGDPELTPQQDGEDLSRVETLELVLATLEDPEMDWPIPPGARQDMINATKLLLDKARSDQRRSGSQATG